MRRGGRDAGSFPTPLVIGTLLVVLGIPLLVALIALRDPKWFPYSDSAGIEMRLRDIGTGNTPLIGAMGRFAGGQASHPGPLGFYLLWPFYRLAGSSGWAMAVAAIALHIVAMGVALWIAVRRGGMVLALAMAAVLAILVHGYGPALLADAWNPFVPLLWWLVFLLAVWSVICDDLVLLPVAVFAGSICAQGHVSYVASTVLLGLFALGWAVVQARRNPETRSSLRRWALISLGIALLVWLPPLIDELWDTGNITSTWKAFTDSSEVALGFGRGVEILLIHLSPVTILTHDLDQAKISFAEGSFVPGLVLCAVWGGCALASWWLKDRALLRLNLVLAVTLGLAVLSCSRVVGDVLAYLFLWAFVLSALMMLAIGWTAVVLLQRTPVRGSSRAIAAGVVALIAIVVVAGALSTEDATHATIDNPALSDQVGRLSGPTVAALREDGVPGGGEDGRYRVTWVDPLQFGLQGFGLLNELERRGFDVGTSYFYRGVVTPHRVREPRDATGIVHLAVGEEIRKWDAKRVARRVAYYEPRTRAEQAEYRRLRAQVIADLRRSPLKDQVRLVDENLVTLLYFERRLPDRTVAAMRRMIEIGLDYAVFVAPVTKSTTSSAR